MHQLNKISDDIILGTAQIKIVGKQGEELKIRALCDNGSQVNLITLSAIERINEKPRFEQTSFCGVGGKTVGSSLGEVWITIRISERSFIFNKFYVVRNITNYCPKKGIHNWENLKGQLADENYNKCGKIHALLGVGVWIQIIEPEIFKTPDNLAVAQKTLFGYVIFENEEDPYQIEKPYIGSILKGESIKKLMEMIKKLWETEEIPETSRRTKEEENCETIFVQQHERDQYGRYIVKIPFNDKIIELGRSKKMAIHQFFAMEKRMKKNKEFADKYKLFMLEYETLGHMSQIWEIKESGYYTPHHGVLSANKFRVVFNASAKTTSGFSLNETQMIGEKLQPDLFKILMHFRQFKIGITADIEKMYRQVLVNQKDRKYQKILWRPDENEPIKVYQLNTVTYGHSCAPHCAIRALIQCANDHEQQFAKGARLVKECFYVDDLLTGANNMNEANEIKRELTSLLSKGRFKITKWKTNGIQENIEFKETDQPSVLGLYWNLSKDVFFYKLRDNNTNEVIWTKRKILSKIGKLYDPNGYLGPIIMKGKIIIQELWKDKRDWDEEIKGEIFKKWEKFNKDLINIPIISINRWLGTFEKEPLQIHGFCDASEKGYGAVIYSRVRLNGEYKAELIVSKSRVAPIKIITTPRLELSAANLLVELIKTILPIFERERQKIQIYCWTDSQITLYWINKSANLLKIYVAHRVSNIQSISEKCQIRWNWIKGKDNPADLISRGTTILELERESKWWKGPDWLTNVQENWPNQPNFSEIDSWKFEIQNEFKKESKKIHLVIKNDYELMRGKWFKVDLTKQDIYPLIEAYGDWQRLKNVTKTIFQAAHNFEKLKNRKIGNITNNFENLAINYLIRKDQERTFSKEIDAAKNNNHAILAKLVLIWDPENEILRVDGRIRSENLSKDQQFPILLDKKGVLASLLIRDAHYHRVRNWPRIGAWPGGVGHGGTQLVQQYLREKYWIIGCRLLTKNIIRKCPICFKLRMSTSSQLMATLPSFRTTPKRAFSRVGIDYAGPVTIRSALGRLPKLSKAWIAVFVCLVTRAIHLELVSELTTQAFIAALKRMIARRGMVTEIISDNATTFVGANNFLTSIQIQLEENKQEIEDQCKIKWTFTTPAAPHQGGIYEAAVKSIKYHLVRIIGEATLTFEEYSTLLCQVEAYVNSRPLTPLNDDPTSLNALTPGHFLVGEALVKIPDEENFTQIPENRLTRWNHITRMNQHFWERWYHEYLNSLINRSKWTKEQRNFRVGDMVILKEENTPPLKWKLARVEEILPGKDNLVRSVIVRTSSGVFKRPIVKLGLLLENED